MRFGKNRSLAEIRSELEKRYSKHEKKLETVFAYGRKQLIAYKAQLQSSMDKIQDDIQTLNGVEKAYVVAKENTHSRKLVALYLQRNAS